MLLNEVGVRDRVAAIARRLTGDPHLRKDLTQEAFLHFRSQEQMHPGQKLSWYLKSCRHHLQDYLRSGHSLDALKRSSLAVEITAAAEADGEVGAENLQIQDTARSLAGADDILALLLPQLSFTQRLVLLCLSQGFTVQETALSLGRSHQAISKTQRNIRKIAVRLEISL